MFLQAFFFIKKMTVSLSKRKETKTSKLQRTFLFRLVPLQIRVANLRLVFNPPHPIYGNVGSHTRTRLIEDVKSIFKKNIKKIILIKKQEKLTHTTFFLIQF
jgi:hypothetical protein